MQSSTVFIVVRVIEGWEVNYETLLLFGMEKSNSVGEDENLTGCGTAWGCRDRRVAGPRSDLKALFGAAHGYSITPKNRRPEIAFERGEIYEIRFTYFVSI